jgi:hypothetical protein
MVRARDANEARIREGNGDSAKRHEFRSAFGTALRRATPRGGMQGIPPRFALALRIGASHWRFALAVSPSPRGSLHSHDGPHCLERRPFPLTAGDSRV